MSSGPPSREEAGHAALAYAVLDRAVSEQPQILPTLLERLAHEPGQGGEAHRIAARHLRALNATLAAGSTGARFAARRKLTAPSTH